MPATVEDGQVMSGGGGYKVGEGGGEQGQPAYIDYTAATRRLGSLLFKCSRNLHTWHTHHCLSHSHSPPDCIF